MATATATSPPSPQPSPALHRLVNLDATWSHFLHKLFSPYTPRAALHFLEFTGDGRLWFPISISFLFLLSPTLSSSLPLSFLLGLILDLVIIGSIKHIIRRPRPKYNSPMGPTLPVDHWSFPSGHASRVCFVATYLGFLSEDLRELGESGIMVWVWIWAVVTAVSRVLLGRHYVVDVVVGAVIGVVEAVVAFYLFSVWSICDVI